MIIVVSICCILLSLNLDYLANCCESRRLLRARGPFTLFEGLHIMSDAQDRGRQQNDENGWEDEENQWKQYLDLSLRSFFLGALPSLQTNLVSKPAQRSNDGSAKSVSLREHGYKQRELWNQRSFRGASPCLKSMLTCQ